MAKYLITYDLVGTSETSDDYKRLIDAIKSYPDYFKVQKWWGRSAIDGIDALKTFIG